MSWFPFYFRKTFEMVTMYNEVIKHAI